MTEQPKRIRLSRAKGWRMPEGAIKVDRSTAWGNPFVVGVDGDAAYCVNLFAQTLRGMLCLGAGPSVEAQQILRRYVCDNLGQLRGRDLACWCRLDKPCHADVLLKIANA